MKFAQVGGVTLHYTEEGIPDGKLLLFINSLGTDLRIWDDVVTHFTESYRIIRYDKRGHGMSDCPPAPYSMRDHATDLAGLMDHLGIEQATLIGISVGGMIAQDFASTWPDRVEQLVLCDTAAKIGTAVMWNTRIDTLRAEGMHALAEPILERWFSPGYAQRSPAAYCGYRNMLTRTPVEGYTGTCEAIRDADLTEATRTIQARTLVLCGAQDGATTPDMAKELADLMPNAMFQTIPDAGHLPCIDQAGKTAVKIEKFL